MLQLSFPAFDYSITINTQPFSLKIILITKISGQTREITFTKHFYDINRHKEFSHGFFRYLNSNQKILLAIKNTSEKVGIVD